MLLVKDLSGLWTRSLQVWADGRRDVTTNVAWLQGLRIFADLRQPPGLSERFRGIESLEQLTVINCEILASQQGFSGTFAARGDHFQWTRQIDYQPMTGSIDAGKLFWQGDTLVEEGLQNEHFEHWHRDAELASKPVWGFILNDHSHGVGGHLLRVGSLFMYTRGRPMELKDMSLGEAVQAAENEHAARAVIDFEISFGRISAEGWHITRSTLPFRAGKTFSYTLESASQLTVADISQQNTCFTRRFDIIEAEGEGF